MACLSKVFDMYYSPVIDFMLKPYFFLTTHLLITLESSDIFREEELPIRVILQTHRDISFH